MNRLDQLVRPILWPAALPPNPVARAAIIAARYAYAMLRDLSAGEISLRAMSLVYTTMLAVVPLLAFSFAVAKGLGLHRELEPLLLQLLQPIGPRAAEITAQVIGFVDNVSSSLLAGMAVALLLLTALSMAQKVEASFNYVWRVDRPRSLTRRLSEYLSVIFVGPIIMVVAAGLIAALSNAAAVTRLREMEPLGSWIAGLGNALPYLLVIVAFSFLYLLIPNTRVRIRPALIGGLFGGVVWAASGDLFAGIIVTSTRFEAIYSGFAIVIILMFWLYLSWLILLLGSQLAFYVQHPYHLPLPHRTDPLNNALRERLALSIMLLIGKDFEQPGHGWRTESLAAELRMPRASVEPVMTALVDADLVTETSELRLVPARDPRRIPIDEIVTAVRGAPERNEPGEAGGWNRTVDDLSHKIDQAIGAVLAGRSLADLVDEDIAAGHRSAPEARAD